MASSDGDSADVIDSALGAIWNTADARLEVHTVDVSTGTSGDGSSTVTYDTSFADGTVFAFATLQDANGDVAVTSAGSSQATVQVSGHSTTSGTVTANLLVVGTDRAA